jgi:hypothetical protein
METGHFILCETSFRIFGYEQRIPDPKQPPALVRDFNVVGAADSTNMNVAMATVGKLLCTTVQNMARHKNRDQFDSYYLS